MTQPTSPPVRVLVVDDSRVIQGVLKRMLSRSPALDVVGTAENVAEARSKIIELRPDVITLDINMPGESGLDFLESLTAERSIPVVILSSVATKGSAEEKRAVQGGAAAVVAKPAHGTTSEFQEMLETLERVITRAAGKVARTPGARPSAANANTVANRPSARRIAGGPVTKTTEAVAMQGVRDDMPIIIGSSTGGPRALRELLGALPPNMPPIVIAQHMPSNFTDSLARRLDAEVALEVVEARSGELLVPGRVLVAPGHLHLKVRASGNGAFVHTVADIPGYIYRPSVDVLMHSAAKAFGAQAIGVVLTGMGSDGADGLLAMRKAGARTIVQDQATSMIFGMPRACIDAGAAEQVRPLGRIAPTLLDWLLSKSVKAS